MNAGYRVGKVVGGMLSCLSGTVLGDVSGAVSHFLLWRQVHCFSDLFVPCGALLLYMSGRVGRGMYIVAVRRSEAWALFCPGL